MVYSQNIKIEQNLGILNKENKTITIPYYFDEPTGKSRFFYEYDVRLFYTQDNKATIIGPMTKVEGDIGMGVVGGNPRRIIWSYNAENPKFDGQNVIFKIEADVHKMVFGGPGNALFSLLLPGLGDHRVNYHPTWRWRWVLQPVLIGGLVGTGFALRNQADNLYDEYGQARNPDEAESLYTQANTTLTLSSSIIIAAGVLWIADISYVFLRGLRNQVKKRQHIEKRSRISPDFETVIFDYNPNLQHGRIGLRFKF
ncbi:MAG: hypothetical protein EAZ55_11915 [Cytophagales bacterium]|nr:MAG: hypothetical protein EAZ55_11915 [Cytophagales bacterium]